MRSFKAVPMPWPVLALVRSNTGRPELVAACNRAAILRELGGASHHMGTTRMADDPKQGVVDKNGLVHGMKNLFVAGSLTFPASSWKLPTFTVVAMAIRLADHLKESMPSFAR